MDQIALACALEKEADGTVRDLEEALERARREWQVATDAQVARAVAAVQTETKANAEAAVQQARVEVDRARAETTRASREAQKARMEAEKARTEAMDAAASEAAAATEVKILAGREARAVEATRSIAHTQLERLERALDDALEEAAPASSAVTPAQQGGARAAAQRMLQRDSEWFLDKWCGEYREGLVQAIQAALGGESRRGE